MEKLWAREYYIGTSGDKLPHSFDIFYFFIMISINNGNVKSRIKPQPLGCVKRGKLLRPSAG